MSSLKSEASQEILSVFSFLTTEPKNVQINTALGLTAASTEVGDGKKNPK